MSYRLSRALLATLILAVPVAAATPVHASENPAPTRAVATSAPLSAQTSQLTLEVRGLDKIKGQLMIGLYNDEDGFEAEQDFKGRTIPVTAETEQVVFDALPTGRYAVKVFHDEDRDGELDTGLFGIPSEPYGFSNNASDPFSAPEWKETRFMLGAQPLTHVIDLD